MIEKDELLVELEVIGKEFHDLLHLHKYLMYNKLDESTASLIKFQLEEKYEEDKSENLKTLINKFE